MGLRVVCGRGRTGGEKRADQLDRRRLPHVVGFRLERQAPYRKFFAFQITVEILLDLIDDIQAVESKITASTKQLEQLEFEELQLKEKLEDCPHCGSVLNEKSKLILLGG